MSVRIAPNRYLCLNSLSGKAIVMSDRVHGIYSDPSSAKTPSELKIVLRLLRAGFIFTEQSHEDWVFDAITRRATKELERQSPKFVIIPNLACNFRCVYCSEPVTQRQVNRVISVDQIDKAFAAMREIRDGRCRHKDALTVMGGEPLLIPNRQAVEHILETSRVSRTRVVIITNGYHLEEYLPLLVLHRRVIKGIQVTLDGPAQIHDARRVLAGGNPTFEKIVAGLELAAARRIRIDVRMNVNADNIDLAPMVRLARARGWDKNNYITLYPGLVDNRSGVVGAEQCISNGMTQLLRAVWPYSKRKSPMRGVFELPSSLVLRNVDEILRGRRPPPQVTMCSTNRVFVFAPDGYVYPCELLGGQEEYAVGRYDPRLQLASDRSPLWTRETRGVHTCEKCRKCRLALLCGSGCPLGGFTASGVHGAECECDARAVESLVTMVAANEKGKLRLPNWT